MKRADRLLSEMFGLNEVTPIKHAETELNMGQSVAKAPRKYTPATAKAQSDVDSSQSLVKKEAGEAGSGLRVTGDQATLEALHQVIDEASNKLSQDLGDDICDWLDDCSRALVGASNGSVTLPAFKATPGLDSFNDDAGTGGEEEY